MIWCGVCLGSVYTCCAAFDPHTLSPCEKDRSVLIADSWNVTSGTKFWNKTYTQEHSDKFPLGQSPWEKWMDIYVGLVDCWAVSFRLGCQVMEGRLEQGSVLSSCSACLHASLAGPVRWHSWVSANHCNGCWRPDIHCLTTTYSSADLEHSLLGPS